MENISYPIQNLIDKNLRKKNDSYEKREQKTWYVSALGDCMRKSYIKRLGVEPDEPIDDRTLRVFEVGHRDEDFILQDIESIVGIKTQGFPTIKNFEREGRLEDEKLGVSGRTDGVITYEDGSKEIIEAKSKNSRSFWYMAKKGEGAMEQHTWQLWFYLWVSKIERGQICYVSKDDLTILSYPILRSDEKLKEDVLGRIKELNHYWEKKILPPKMDSKCWQCRYCQFKKTCKSENLKIPKVVNQSKTKS